MDWLPTLGVAGSDSRFRESGLNDLHHRPAAKRLVTVARASSSVGKREAAGMSATS